MAITQSVLRIYADELLQTLVNTITTSGSSTEIDVSSLSAGTKYWATVEITDNVPLTSEESEAYGFYTLPYVAFNGTPSVSEVGELSALLAITTTDTGCAYTGFIYDTHSDFSHAEYCTVDLQSLRFNYQSIPASIEVEQNTTYYLKPFVTDVFGRTWVNDAATVSVLTSASAPIINWYGISAVSATQFNGSVKIESEIPITAITVTYTQDGGSPQTISVTPDDGIVPINITGLKQGTGYSVYVTATNATGSSSTQTITFTTNEAQITVKAEVNTVDPSTNIINATSDVEYDQSIITITGHYIDLYENKEHKGTAFESVSGGTSHSVNLNLSHANPDETYYVFGRVTYTVSGDSEEYTAWSEPSEAITYSLLSFGKIEVDNTDAKVDFSVVGDTKSTVVEYSADGENWEKVPIKDPTGEKLYFTGLEPNTTYYLRGRTQSSAGWSGYATASFSTGSQAATDIYITSITNVSTTSATIKLTIE